MMSQQNQNWHVMYIFLMSYVVKNQIFNRNTAAAAAAALVWVLNKERKTYSISIPSKSYASINLTQFAANVARAVASAAILGKLLLNVHPPIEG
jgi:hypothetical protein